jgi:hypothetical protein
MVAGKKDGTFLHMCITAVANISAGNLLNAEVMTKFCYGCMAEKLSKKIETYAVLP